MSFYVTLPSDASMNIFPQNVQSDYTTVLKTPLELNDAKYEVGLVEISYSQNIQVDLGYITIKEMLRDKSVHVSKVPIVVNEYITLDKFLDTLNFQIYCYRRDYQLGKIVPTVPFKNVKELDSFHFQNYNKSYQNDTKLFKKSEESDRILTFNAYGDNSTFSLAFDGKIAVLLNAHLKKDYLNTEIFNFYIDFSIIHFIDTFYIYTDIIEDQYVGDVLAPLLRTVATIAENKYHISTIFENPHYVSLKHTRISTINISILDIFGRRIQFVDNYSRVLIKLHFRQYGL